MSKKQSSKYLLSLCLLLSGLFVSSCAENSQVADEAQDNPLGKSHESIVYVHDKVMFDKKSSAYLAYANDGHDDYRDYPGSGDVVMGLMMNSFKPYVACLKRSQAYHGAQLEYIAAQKQGYDYFVLPRINDWTQGNSLLTGVADKVKVTIKIYNLKTNQLLDDIKISGFSSRMPGFAKSPRELLLKPLQKMVSGLFV